MEKQATLKEQPTGRSLYVEHDELRGRAIKDAVRERETGGRSHGAIYTTLSWNIK